MSAPQHRLTVAMIARDAEQTIGAALCSVQAIAQELLVVDTGSRDQTRRVAAAAGARVVDFPWCDDFAIVRNFALSQSQGDWILWLDAGETLDAETAQLLPDFIRKSAERTKAYALWVLVPPAGNNIAPERAARVRLMPRRGELRFEGRVRESLDASLASLGINVEQLAGTIHRQAINNDPQVKANKAVRDLGLLKLEIAKLGQTPELLVALGEALIQLNNPTGATAAFRSAIEKSSGSSTALRMAYYGLLEVDADDAVGRKRKLGICSEALARFPLDAQLLCALGGYLQAEDRLDLAQRSYLAALEHGEVDPFTWHVPDVRQIAAVCLSLLYQLQDAEDDAREVLEDVLKRHGESARVRRHLMELHIKHDRRQEALTELDRLSGNMPNREAMRSAVRGACLAARGNWIPALAYLQTAHAAGCRDPICLRPLAQGLIQNGEIAAAEPILHQWHEVEPRNIEVKRYLEALSAGELGKVGQASDSSDHKRILRVDPPAAGAPVPIWPSVPMQSSIELPRFGAMG